MARETDLLIAERQRLAALVDARQKALSQAEGLAADESRKADVLAERAKGLRDLLGRLEADIEAETKAAASGDPRAKEARERFAMLAGKDPARLAPKTPFQEMKGALPLPISGTLIKGFNAPDGIGGTVKGVAYATRPGAVVSAPCDGWVAFAGPFRTFGQLLIINAGGGYYLLLAGMERVNVALGQFVLAGEPVAVMGESSKATSASVGADTNQPVLYIEFRKDGNSFDPSSWWANSTGGKVRG
jgi:septal ring factor EnvC (AmiA/AmiB activator)